MTKRQMVTKNLFEAWTPLANPLFRAIFIAATVSNIGTWIQNTGGAWLMTSLTDSSFQVALMQTATSLPLFLFSLPAGSLADIFNRRKLLLLAQVWMLLTAAILAVLTFANNIGPWTLLLLTFALGIGNAFNAPAWLAAVPEIVSRKELGKALALNAVAYNMAIAIGPAVAGILLSRVSAGWIFLLNALSFIAVIIVFLFWKDKQKDHGSLPAEKITSAMRITIRYVHHTPLLQAVLIRSALFILFASSFWALLPFIARFQLHLDAKGFGILYGFMGIGSVAGATAMPKLQQAFTIDRRITLMTFVFAVSLLMLGYLTNLPLIYLAMFIAGFTWIILLSTFNTYVQSVVASWVKARAIGVYLLVIQGGLAIGSMFWGFVAGEYSVQGSLIASVIGLLIGFLAGTRFSLATADAINVTPSSHWPEPILLRDIDYRSGPVLVSIIYTIDPKNRKEFIKAAKALGPIRRRSGSLRWGIFKDTADDTRYIENFVTESWGEHLRQHRRITVSDKALEDKVNSFQVDGKRPQVFHYIAKKMM